MYNTFTFTYYFAQRLKSQESLYENAHHQFRKNQITTIRDVGTFIFFYDCADLNSSSKIALFSVKPIKKRSKLDFPCSNNLKHCQILSYSAQSPLSVSTNNEILIWSVTKS